MLISFPGSMLICPPHAEARFTAENLSNCHSRRISEWGQRYPAQFENLAFFFSFSFSFLLFIRALYFFSFKCFIKIFMDFLMISILKYFSVF